MMEAPWKFRSRHIHAAIALADIVRQESREAIERLKGMGLQCMMLTGDAEAVAKTVAIRRGVDVAQHGDRGNQRQAAESFPVVA